MKRFLIISIILAFPAPVFSQGWNLDRCLDHVVRHNPEIAMQENVALQYKARFAAECMEILPTFGATFSSSSASRTPSLALSGEFTLFHGFSKHHRRHVARMEYDISVLDILGLKEDLAIKTIESYLLLAQSFQQLDYATAGYEASLRERETTMMLVNGGTQPMSALLQVEAQLASDRSAMVDAECAVKSRRLELCQTLDIPYDKDFMIDREEINDTLVPPQTWPEEMVSAALRNNPKYLRSLAVREHRKTVFLKSLSELSPSVSLRADWAMSFGNGPQVPVKSVGLHVALPFLSGWHYGPQIREASLERKRAEIESYAIMRELETTFERAVIESGNCYSKSLAALENVRALEESLRINRLKYEQGMITATGYILAKSEYEKARSAFLKAKWQYMFQLKVIEHYLSSYENTR